MIPWDKIESKPEKKVSVEGRVLLDFQAKIVDLEKDLALKEESLQKTLEDLNNTQYKLSGREKSLVKVTEKFTAAKKNLDSVAEQKLDVDIELTKLKPTIEELTTLNEELEKRLASQKENLENEKEKHENEITKLTDEMKFLQEKQLELNQLLSFKDKTIENQKKELFQKEEDLKSAGARLQMVQDQNSQLNSKIANLEKDLSEIEGAPEILKNIKEKMLIKGFISDKEIIEIEKNFFG